MKTIDRPALKAKPAISKLSIAIDAIDAARDALGQIDRMKTSVVKWGEIARDPAVSDEVADSAAGELTRASEELRLAELSIDRRKAAVDRAVNESLAIADEVLELMEQQAFALERASTAKGFELCRALVAPDAAALSIDEAGGASRERAIGGMVYHLRGVYESTALLDRVSAVMRADSTMRALLARDVLNEWETTIAAIEKGMACMQSALDATK